MQQKKGVAATVGCVALWPCSVWHGGSVDTSGGRPAPARCNMDREVNLGVRANMLSQFYLINMIKHKDWKQVTNHRRLIKTKKKHFTTFLPYTFPPCPSPVSSHSVFHYDSSSLALPAGLSWAGLTKWWNVVLVLQQQDLDLCVKSFTTQWGLRQTKQSATHTHTHRYTQTHRLDSSFTAGIIVYVNSVFIFVL